MRSLREYRSIAQMVHWCDSCCSYIHPGEQYEGTVYVSGDCREHRLVVFRSHINPVCEPPDDPDEEREINRERNRESSRAAA